MRRKITVTLIIIVCFLLQSTLFKALSFASISPNLLDLCAEEKKGYLSVSSVDC